MFHETSIEKLPRTSSQTIKKLQKLEIHTYLDLLHYYPFRYEDLSLVSKIKDIQPGETVTLQGKVSEVKNQRTRRGLFIQKAFLDDGTGNIELVWYNQRYLTTVLKKGAFISVSGPLELFGNTLNMKPVEYELMESQTSPTIHTGRLVPVYPQIRGLSSRTIREKVWYVLSLLHEEDIEDFLPKKIIEDNHLISEKTALEKIHFPKNKKESEQAQLRLAFDELFVEMLSSQLVKKAWEKERVSIILTYDKEKEKKINEFISSLPFELTSAQKRSVDEILADLKKTQPMNRFLQGDVGSGKTVVAAVAAYLAYLNGTQTLFMAPTEILAQQHFQTLSHMLKNTGIKLALQTGSTKMITKKQKNSDEFDVIVGTHALVSDFLSFDKVGLVIIDEQHRFGVRQRALLKQKGSDPHLLTMTATPIPRTVSLTIYSELDLSVIDEMPKGRKEIKTHVVPHHKREDGYIWMKNKLKEGDQMYIICPLIEESESETMKTVRAATVEFERLQNEVFTDFNLALLHGKMKGKEKDEIMDQFKQKKYHSLVSTSVVEVGIDVPNATIMIIEGAERFGLAQLHQLRGRVGRGEKQSYCFLYTSTKESQHNKRLQFFSKTNSGMRLAEYDLKLRGPGQKYGTQQHGYSDLKLADISDYGFVKKVKDSVSSFLENYKLADFPELENKIDKEKILQISPD